LLTKHLREEFPTVLAAGTPPDHEGELTDPEVPVRRVPFVRPVQPRSDAAALRAMRDLLEEVRPAIVHTHMAKAGAIGRTAAFLASSRPRTVHTFHGHVLEGYFSKPVERAFVLAERVLAKRTDVLVAVSPQVRDALLDLRIGRPEQYLVVPLGLPLTAHLAVTGRSGILRSQLGLGVDAKLVVALGRLAPIKDLHTLLRAMTLVPEAHLAILGDGEVRAALESEAAALGMASRVHFTGWWMDVPAALADADVVALSSKNEGTPVALIEAHACGRPVVATDVGGVRTVVLHERTGYLVPPAAEQPLAERLRTLIAEPERARDMGAAGREHVRATFSEDRLVEDLRGLYTDLARRHRRR
jgi:glycosyltransferase involved in cell wall biosynthesis